MIGKNMTKSTLRIASMDNKILRVACLLSVFSLLAGCSCFDNWGAGNTYMEEEPSSEAPVQATQPMATAPKPSIADSEPQIVPPADIAGEDSEFVNFTETNANYREFGERTPRDQKIVNSGVGSNMSASIPPTIEEEVSDYEMEVTEANSSDEDVSEEKQFAGEDPVEDWLAEEGNSLKGLLTEWSERSGWRLIWNTNRNYTLTAGAMFRGRFADVSSALIRAFARARPAPIATFYKGNRVLVVETMEDENAYN